MRLHGALGLPLCLSVCETVQFPSGSLPHLRKKVVSISLQAVFMVLPPLLVKGYSMALLGSVSSEQPAQGDVWGCLVASS